MFSSIGSRRQAVVDASSSLVVSPRVGCFSGTCAKVLEQESAEVEGRRKGLEETQEAGKQELDATRDELKAAADRLEAEKEDLKGAWKVKVL